MRDVKPLIEFCVNNLTEDVLEIKKKLETDYAHQVDVLEYGCLGYCGMCATQPYVLMDGDVVKAETALELLEKIKKKMDDVEFRF